MRIGIFEGRKARYNKQILKVLIENQPLKPWDIAKQLAIGSMDKTQDVYATLIRKKGRLNELLNKEYLQQLSNRRYIPTFKGIIAYLLTEKHPKISDSYKNLIQNLSMQLPKNIRIPLLNLKVDKKVLETSFTMEDLLQLKKFLQDSLDWVDLDSIHEEEIFTLILTRINRKLIEEIAETLKKFGKYKEV